MRHLFMLLLPALFALPAAAQEVEKPERRVIPERKQETGLFFESKFDSGNDNEDYTQIGVNYKYWLKRNMGLRFSLSWTEFNTGNGANNNYYNIIKVPNDTVSFTSQEKNMQYAAISGGLEFQRAFYKRFYLYAGADLRLGYGAGYTDESQTDVYYSQNGYYQSTQGINRYDLQSFMMGMSPFIGAKYNGRRMVFGLELVQLSTFSFVKEDRYNTTTSNVDMDWGITRIYLNYKF